MKNILEIRRMSKESIAPDQNIVFNVASPYSEGIDYDPISGEITFNETGQYSVRWWVATETTLTGCIQFALKSSQGDVLISCSPTKKGQLVGFGAIDVKSANVTLSLVNMGGNPVVLSQTAPLTAALLAMRIPEDDIIPTFGVNDIKTLEPEETATADIQEDVDNPNNWLLSFGIPRGETGAQGPIGPTGSTGPTGPAWVPEYYNFTITSNNNLSNPVNFIIGNIRFAFSYYNATTGHLRFYPAQSGVTVLYDYRRMSYFNTSLQPEARDSSTLNDSGFIADDSIYSQSNEWQSSFLRQRNPDGTWSFCECKIFASASLSRITLWVEWIYKKLAVDEWQ